jgi:hypothetical protein
LNKWALLLEFSVFFLKILKNLDQKIIFDGEFKSCDEFRIRSETPCGLGEENENEIEDHNITKFFKKRNVCRQATPHSYNLHFRVGCNIFQIRDHNYSSIFIGAVEHSVCIVNIEK